MLNTQVVVAPFKLNLCLHVVGVRHDGYHLIESVSVFCQEGDIITLDVDGRDQDHLQITGLNHQILSENIDDNLIFKGIRLLREHHSFPWVSITLHKVIPIQAGYGGGSSDVAAVMKAINQMFNLELSEQDLSAMSLSLGADIAMCLYSRPCLATGTGEVITPLEIMEKKLSCLLVKPPESLSTPHSFKRLVHKNNPSIPRGGNFIEYALTQGRNDLAVSSMDMIPRIQILLTQLQATNPIKAAMSGSGSGLFALYDNEEKRNNAYKTFKNQYPDIFCFKTAVQL